MINKKSTAILLGLASMSFSMPASAGDLADMALGTWLRPNNGWVVEFSMCGDNLCGEVISGEGTDKKTGGPVVGVRMLYDLEKAGDDRWRGKMYNPDDGGTYRGSVTVRSENEIKMAGCLMRVMCRSEIWERVGDNPATADEMMKSDDDMMESGDDMMKSGDDMMESGDDMKDAKDDMMKSGDDMKDAKDEMMESADEMMESGKMMESDEDESSDAEENDDE